VTLKATTINDVIPAIVTSVSDAVSYGVYDGFPRPKPGRGTTKYLVVGAESLDDDENFTMSANMQQEWRGLGAVAREETLSVNCVAVGIADSIANARSNANDILNDVKTNLAIHPTAQTYNALIDQVTGVRSKNAYGGAMVQVEFIISVKARIRDA